jgi:hypothetical protein
MEEQQRVWETMQMKYESDLREAHDKLKFYEISNDEQNSLPAFHARIGELEDALRQSVAITAEREIVMAKQKAKNEKLENEVCELFYWI